MNLARKHAYQRNPFEGLYKWIPSLRKRRTQGDFIQTAGARKTANKLAKTFARISSGNEQQKLRQDQAMEELDWTIDCLEVGNGPRITLREFTQVMTNTKRKSSPGPDGLTYEMWRKVCEIASIERDILEGLNDVLLSGDIPAEWKQALIYPVPKRNGEYRPISLLNTISKILEKIVTTRLDRVLPARATQFGCTKQRSTQAALVRFLHQSSVAAEQGKYFGAISVDFSKAYDRVNRIKLIHKLIDQRASPYLVRFVHNWLKDRQNFVEFEGVRSESYTTTLGVPQGSAISVALFKSYVQNCPVEDCRLNMFMDDILFWRKASTYKELQ